LIVSIGDQLLRCALMLACRVMCHYVLQDKSYDYLLWIMKRKICICRTKIKSILADKCKQSK